MKIAVEEIFLIMSIPGLDMFRVFLHRLIKRQIKKSKKSFQLIIINWNSKINCRNQIIFIFIRRITYVGQEF